MASNHRLRVLLIDDSALDQELIVRELRRAGYQVVCKRVETDAAMRLELHEKTWDVVLCDYSMPSYSPEHALTTQKSLAPKLPFIVISGVIDEEIAVRMIKAGANDFISKNKLQRLPLAIMRELRQAGKDMQHELDLQSNYEAVIAAWGKAMELRDHDTRGHTLRVTDLTMRLAKEIGFSGSMVNLQRGALLHDIGKIGIPDQVLLKPEPLSDDERRIIEKHPQLAYDMLKDIDFLKEAVWIPYCHHEKWDGSGYPRGLKRLDIPFEARIFAVVDVFDALTSQRPYRELWSRDVALGYLREQKARIFDPSVTDAFLHMMAGIRAKPI